MKKFPTIPFSITLAAFGLLYCLTFPAAHVISDSYEWISAISDGQTSTLFHPHHLIYNAVAWAWTRPLLYMGFSLWISVQLLSAFGGMIALAGMFMVLWKISGESRTAVVGTAMFGTAFSVWIFCVDVEVYIFASAALIWSFYSLLRAVEKPCARNFFIVGMTCGLAGLFHQSSCFFLFPSIAGVCLVPVRIPRKFFYAMLPVLGFGLVAGIPYIMAGTLIGGARTVGELFVWMTKHAQYGYYGGINGDTPYRMVVGLGRSLIYGTSVIDAMRVESGGWDGRAIITALSMAIVGVGYLACLGVAVFNSPMLKSRGGSALFLAAVWFLCNGAFSAYYEPQNIEWWCIPFPPFILMTAISCSVLEGRRFWMVAMAVVLGQFVGNMSGDMVARKSPSFDRFYNAAAEVERVSEGKGLDIVPALIKGRLPEGALSFHILLRQSKDDIGRAMDSMCRQIENAFAEGRPVVVFEDIMAREKLRYQPQAAGVIRYIEEATAKYGAEEKSVVIPWEDGFEFGKISPLREKKIYLFKPGSKEAAEWLDVLRAYSDDSGKEAGPK
ncbi:MAG: hypothetical protein JXR97_15935 [Planctomycetes bacterium]|nr:hypothetical protein [Planctomycetota bacterium]